MAISNTVPVTGPIAPLDSRDIYGTHTAKYGVGGFYSVGQYSDLMEIPAFRLLDGEPLVFVRATNRWYLYMNSEWVLADFTNGSSCCLIVGSEEDGDDIVTTLCRLPIDADPDWWMDSSNFVQNTIFT